MEKANSTVKVKVRAIKGKGSKGTFRCFRPTYLLGDGPDDDQQYEEHGDYYWDDGLDEWYEYDDVWAARVISTDDVNPKVAYDTPKLDLLRAGSGRC